MAPELFEGHAGDAANERYALGVTLYRMFTGGYPYGKVEIFSQPRFGKHMSPDQYVEELAIRLKADRRNAARPFYRPPLIERNGARF